MKLPTIDKSKPAVVLSLRISSDVLRKVDEVAVDTKTTRSRFLRDAIDSALPQASTALPENRDGD